MSAQLILDLVPLGSIVRYFDGTPRPPERHRKKLADWERRNGSGRLVAKKPEGQTSYGFVPGSFTLHEGDIGGNGVVVVSINRTFSVNSALKFAVTERPAIGAVRVLDRDGKDAELLHLAASHAEAQAWLATHGYPHAVLDEVTANEMCADDVEGRAR